MCSVIRAGRSPAIQTVYISPFLPPSPFKAQVPCGVFQHLERRDGRISDRSQREQVSGEHARLTRSSVPHPFLGPHQLPLPGRAYSAPATFPAIQAAVVGANASLTAERGRTGSGCRQEKVEVGSRKTERFPAANLGPGTSSLPVLLRDGSICTDTCSYDDRRAAALSAIGRRADCDAVLTRA